MSAWERLTDGRKRGAHWWLAQVMTTVCRQGPLSCGARLSLQLFDARNQRLLRFKSYLPPGPHLVWHPHSAWEMEH